MNFNNYNGMFILALVALSIVGIICLGLLTVVAISVLAQKREGRQEANLPSAGSSPPVSPSPAYPQDEEKFYLTVSDWVNYLSGEKFGIMGAVLNVSTVLVALVALIYSISSNTLWTAIANGVVVLALTGYILMKIFRPFERRGKLAERILKNVMSGELKSEVSIRKAWLDGLNLKRQSETSIKPTDRNQAEPR